LKIDKKRIRRTLYWFAAELVVLAIFLLLLTYRPKGFEPVVPDNTGRVSTYLTHELGADYYNKTQLGEPFELVVKESGVNDIIRTGGFSGQVGDVTTSLPVVHFVPGKVVVMASAYVSGMEFVATIETRPWIDETGRFNAKLESFKVGAVPVTIAAKAVAKKMYNEQAGGVPADSYQAQIASAILDDQPFDPLIDLGGKPVRINKIEVGEQVLKLGITPLKSR
jgi:hypothetical protein